MAKKNFKSHIEDAIEVKVKKYLYVIRPAGMFVWLLHSVDKNTGKIDLRNFEIDFMVILDAIKDHMSSDCFIEINRIINKKKDKGILLIINMDQLPNSMKTPIVNANASMNILTPIEI